MEHNQVAADTKLVVVVGATVQQRGSVVKTPLATGHYAIRSITRNLDSRASQVLIAKGVSMVHADLN